jgi:hypothetical protein
MTHNADVQDAILQALGQSDSQVQEVPLQQEETPVELAYYFEITGSPAITITDSLGQSIDILNSPPSTDVPDIAAYKLGETTYIIVIPTDQQHTVAFEGADRPLQVEVRRGTGATTTEAARYLDLELPANTAAQIELPPDTIQSLRHDEDGDGTFERVIDPTAAVSGAAANDTDAPDISIDTAEQPDGTVNVTITATDDSGVSKLLYSLDGTIFSPYTESLQFDPAQASTIYAFADDQVGNRSSVAVAQLRTLRTYLPIIIRGTR